MKNKEKVLKEVLKIKWDGKTKEDKLGFGLRRTIDLTLASVGKMLDNEISLRERNKEKELEKVPNHSSRYIALCNEAIDTLNRVKQKLGIK